MSSPQPSFAPLALAIVVASLVGDVLLWLLTGTPPTFWTGIGAAMMAGAGIKIN